MVVRMSPILSEIVSLFTREWIEILFARPLVWFGRPVSLFTREWIEISCGKIELIERFSLPLYEGVDWNLAAMATVLILWQVSLFTREWIEIGDWELAWTGVKVSLFTREWIEIWRVGCRSTWLCGLPLYEGVDWNPLWARSNVGNVRSPSLRGSGLKYPDVCKPLSNKAVSLFTREWIEIANGSGASVTFWLSPSLRGSGLKWRICDQRDNLS